MEAPLNAILQELYNLWEDDMREHGEWKNKPVRVLVSREMMMNIKSDPSIIQHLSPNYFHMNSLNLILWVEGLNLPIETTKELIGKGTFKIELSKSRVL